MTIYTYLQSYIVLQYGESPCARLWIGGETLFKILIDVILEGSQLLVQIIRRSLQRRRSTISIEKLYGWCLSKISRLVHFFFDTLTMFRENGNRDCGDGPAKRLLALSLMKIEEINFQSEYTRSTKEEGFGFRGSKIKERVFGSYQEKNGAMK